MGGRHPEKVFILECGTYIELTYEDFCRRRQTDTSYADKLFISLHGMIMEVSRADYKDFYRKRNRQKYIEVRSARNKDFSYDMLTTDDFNGEDILVDPSPDVSEIAEHLILMDRLQTALSLLSKEEQLLVKRYFYNGISETKLSAIYGVSQQAISKRIHKVCAKLKKFLEI